MRVCQPGRALRTDWHARASRAAGRRTAAEQPTGRGNRSRSERAVAMSEPIRILVAEDHLVARVGVSTIVNMQPDMTVVAEAANGAQAVDLFRQHRPDIALLDLRMPVMGGIEAAAAICKDFPEAGLI